MSGFRAAPEVLTTPLDDGGAVLFHVGARTTFRLNETGAAIWERLRAGDDRDAIAAHLERDYAVDAARARAGVDALCDDLLHAELIVERDR